MMSHAPAPERPLEQHVFDEWPDTVRTLFDGSPLANKTGFTASLLTVDATTQRMAVYADAMLHATQAMNSNRYQDAVNYFQAALQASPGDAFATTGLQQAQQRLRQPPRTK